MRKRYKNYLGRNFKKKRSRDKISKKHRSNLMSKIRSKGTNFETSFIKALRRNVKTQFSTHVRAIKGNPDIVFKKRRLCIFLDSDFWHGWQYPRWKHLMKNSFWRNKILNNRKRDKKTTQYLRRQGWKVLRVWEHQIRTEAPRQITKIVKLLT